MQGISLARNMLMTEKRLFVTLLKLEEIHTAVYPLQVNFGVKSYMDWLKMENMQIKYG